MYHKQSTIYVKELYTKLYEETASYYSELKDVNERDQEDYKKNFVWANNPNSLSYVKSTPAQAYDRGYIAGIEHMLRKLGTLVATLSTGDII